MAKAEKTSAKNFVTVALAEDVELARDYVQMLRDNEIPARFHVNEDLLQGSRVAILVPDEMIEQAQIFIQARCSGPDFYDYAFDNIHNSEDAED
jgi:hypothetical protein